MIQVPEFVKDAFKNGISSKNYRFVVLDSDGTEEFVIDNNNIISESVKINEKLCSTDIIKFGLCEGSVIEFQYFDKPSIKGKRIHAFLGVEYENRNLEENSEQTIEEKNYLQELLFVIDAVPTSNIYMDINEENGSIYTIIGGYTVVYADGYEENIEKIEPFFQPNTEHGNVINVKTLVSVNAGSLSISLTYTVYKEKDYFEIPMGFFDIESASLDRNKGTIKATGYNKLKSTYLDVDIAPAVKELFGSKTSVSAKEIRIAFLGDYEISEGTLVDYNVPQIRGPINVGNIDSVKTFRCGSTGLRARAKYGIDTPFSFYSCGDVLSGIYPYFDQCTYEMDVSEFESIVLKLSELDAYEQTVFDFIKNEAQKAFTCGGARFMSYMMKPISVAAKSIKFATPPNPFMEYRLGNWEDLTEKYIGWHSFISMCLVYKNGKSEYYTTIGKNNRVSGVKGTFSQINNRIIKNVSKIRVNLPTTLFFYNSSRFPTNDLQRYIFERNYYLRGTKIITGDIWYKYYVSNNNLVESKTKINFSYDSNISYYTRNAIKVTDYTPIRVFGYQEGVVTPADNIQIPLANIESMTLRDIVSSVYELNAVYGKLDRITDLFGGVALNNNMLYPSDELYPSDDLYPRGSVEVAQKSFYSKLWTDSIETQKFRKLIVSYKKSVGGEKKDAKIEKIVNEDGTTDYEMSNNWLFNNLVWTEAQINVFLDEMVQKIKDVEWFPFEMNCIGLPYLETGDKIEITSKDGTYSTYILERQLDGIQLLQDKLTNGILDN